MALAPHAAPYPPFNTPSIKLPHLLESCGQKDTHVLLLGEGLSHSLCEGAAITSTKTRVSPGVHSNNSAFDLHRYTCT